MLSDFVPQLEDLVARGSTAAATALPQLEDLVARGRRIAAALAEVEVRRAAAVAVPFAEVLEVARGLAAFVDDYFDDLDFPPELFLAARAAQRGLLDLQVLRRRFAAQEGGTAGAATPRATTAAPLVPYRLRQGDTVERLALAYLGSAARAQEILELNDLVYPFLRTERALLPAEFAAGEFSDEFTTRPFPNRDGVPAGVRVTGELIYLPTDARVPLAATTFTDLDAELYGRDWRLDAGVVALTEDGAVRTVAGKDNIVQALSQRIRVAKGELVLHPTYGMDRFLAVGVEGTVANAIFSGLEVARTVRQDPRVVAVRNIEILFRDTTNYAAMRVDLIGPGQRDLPLNLVVPDTISPAGGAAG